mgnify:FL=1
MELKTKLIEKARRIIDDKDPSHDLAHALRVLRNAEYIADFEGGDLGVIIPAALFHDVIVYPKHSSKSKYSARDSAILAREILESLGYCKDKISLVEEAILEHSYGKGIKPERLESQIVQDADRLEAVGAIAIMRTFCSTGQMQRKLYHFSDPFCVDRKPDAKAQALDLFYDRLLKVGQTMNTETARNLAGVRTKFLYQFLEQLESELLIC